MGSDNAKDLLTEYHDSIGGPPERAGKRRKKSTNNLKRPASSAVDSPIAEGSAKKRGKQSAAGLHNGTTIGQKDLPEGSWEDQVSQVTSIVEEAGKDPKGQRTLIALLEWNDGIKTQHPLDTLRRKCPQKLLNYYEAHLYVLVLPSPGV